MKITFRIIIFLLLFSQVSLLRAQKEWNNWYFGRDAALTFNSGVPVSMPSGANDGGYNTACVSDSLGNLLFYTDSYGVYYIEPYGFHIMMPNGFDMIRCYGSNGPLILPVPEKPNLYYIITIHTPSDDLDYIPGFGLYYAIVDMSLNNGYGDVTVKKQFINLPVPGKAMDKLACVRHKNNKDIWFIARAFPGKYFVSFLLTSTGIFANGVISESLIDYPADEWGEATTQIQGEIEISPDGKKMAVAYNNAHKFEFGNFNIATGKYTPQFIVDPPDPDINNIYIPRSLEFSPNSKLLYCSAHHIQGNVENLYQYDATMNDSVSFAQSIMVAGTILADALQLGPDDKIYGGRYEESFLDVIESPNERGFFCNYKKRAVSLSGQKSVEDLPMVFQKFFCYYKVQNLCVQQPVQFTSNIWPLPDSVLWYFDDPSSGTLNVSTEINPQHVFNQTGDYNVSLIAYWMGGRTDTTTKLISIPEAPSPGLSDTVRVCVGESVLLESDPFAGYLWSTNETSQSINANNTGSYWVEVINDDGCKGRDTVEVVNYKLPLLDSLLLNIAPTTCGNSNGSITGLQIKSGTPPYTAEWVDNNGTVVSTLIDEVINLPVDNYYLWVTDGNGCTNQLAEFDINDTGDVLVDTVIITPSFCGNDNGTITVDAVSGLTDILEYSKDNGSSWQDSNVFTGLEPLGYAVRVRVPDGSGCQDTYDYNLVYIEEVEGPAVTSSATAATGNDNDGTVTLLADGFGQLTYILNDVIIQDTGYFIGLTCGDYSYRVEDENECITTGTIEVPCTSGYILSAITGNDTVCLTQNLQVPVMVDNFTEVRSFKVTLNYNPSKVTCTGYLAESLNADLEGLRIEVFPSLNRIVATWTGASSVSLSGLQKLFELIFIPKETGINSLTWDQSNTMTWFADNSGNLTDVDFQVMDSKVNDPAKVTIREEIRVCEGGMFFIGPIASGTYPIVYDWLLPDGNKYSMDLYAGIADASSIGYYKIKITDGLGCMDSTMVKVSLVPLPSAGFPGDSIEFQNSIRLEAISGYDYYLWSTGDTTRYIDVTEEGTYSVYIKSGEQCYHTDSITLVDTYVKVPNAFTPNDDGLNDVFRIIIDPEKIRKYKLEVYNRWGHLVYQTVNSGDYWTGSDCAPGVYTWMINYESILAKKNLIKGSVTLIK